MKRKGRSKLGPVSGDMNYGVLDSTGNSSGPSVGASSLVTDANSALSGLQLQCSTNVNNDLHIRLPASPMSFSSNNMSGSSVIDDSIMQQSPHQEQVHKQQALSATSETMVQDPGNPMHSSKKARLDMKKDDIMQQQMIQQLLQGLEPALQDHQNLQLQAVLQQQRLAQLQQQKQQHIMQSLPQMQRVPITFQQQQQVRQHLQQQAVEVLAPVKSYVDSVIGSRRLMQYLYHQRHRPVDNSILYWRKFVAEYFAPLAKKRWCLSLYDNISNHALGVFLQSSKDTWQCDLCGKSGKGFEATFEVLPRLFQIKFHRGLIDENLFLGVPCECRSSKGIVVLEYEKVAYESVYEHFRVVHEGKLRVIFTPELKILFWDFCTQRHEEFAPRRVLAPQVNELLHVAQKYQTAVNENGSEISQQDLQVSCNMFITAGRQLARNLELQSLNELGFSRRYVRYLQVSEVLNSMKDLIDFSQEHKIGPIESLKNYTSQAAAKLQRQNLQELEQSMAAHSLPSDKSMLSKGMGFHPGLNNHMNDNLVARRIFNSNQPSVRALNNYHNFLGSSPDSNQNVLQQEQLGPISGPKQAQSKQFQGSASSIQSDAPVNSISGQHQPPQDGCLLPQNNPHHSQVNQHLQQHAIQHMLQQVINNSKGGPQRSASTLNANGLVTPEVIEGGNTGVPVRMNPGSVGNGSEFLNMHTDMRNNSMRIGPSRSNNFRSVSRNSNISGNSLNSRADLIQNMDLPELHQIAKEFEHGLFGGDPSDVGYGWKV